jgi:CheY-like chemotaxis protein
MKPKKPNAAINILLAEDDIDDRFFFEKAVNQLAFEIKLETVNDGEQLLEYLGENIQNLPDIIFLDISMPRKTGIESLSDIYENEILNKIPIVMLSTSYTKDASYEQGIKDMLLRMGAKEYIRKPSDIEGLKLVIENSLKSIFKLELK